ncbi:hypothetical protein CI238_06874 [Colletotrichum incanum]|uniref:Uncharacterized protein n=1 Tax=Colletotrichum incanum TaxID=1573173 RepID=A0A166ZKS1_COLIC|nr:hypothetical protein CI238_06874 [Colletotrichum incanum]
MTDNAELLNSFERRIVEHREDLQTLKEQINLFLGSGELSRDIWKAHDHIQLNALGKDVVTCRQSGKELRKRQTEQQGLILRSKRDIESGDPCLRDAKKDPLAHRKQKITSRRTDMVSKLDWHRTANEDGYRNTTAAHLNPTQKTERCKGSDAEKS